jgi:hypothetical protein
MICLCGAQKLFRLPTLRFLTATAKWSKTTRDRPFGNCLFWMATDAIKYLDGMGPYEMNWEVSGFAR